ncbi:hypothetical protein JCM21900_001661 [Sporobolomyces salmonicolor]
MAPFETVYPSPVLPSSDSATTLRPSTSQLHLTSRQLQRERDMRFRSRSSGNSDDGTRSSPGGSTNRLASLFHASPTKHKRPELPKGRSGSMQEVLLWRRHHGEAGLGDVHPARTDSYASLELGSTGVRFSGSIIDSRRPCTPSSRSQGGIGESPHARSRSATTYSTESTRSTYSSGPPQALHSAYPSTSTSVPSQLFALGHDGPWPRPRSASLTRIQSNTSSSAASSDYPRTPGQTPIAYNRSDAKGKGKEEDVEMEGPWAAGLPALAPEAASIRRTPMPPMIDPRFTFPMRRSGAIGSGSASGSGGSRGSVGLGFGSNMGEQRWSGRTDNVDEGRRSGETSFVASLGARPLLDDFGHPLPLYPSNATASRHPPNFTRVLHSPQPSAPSSPSPPALSPPSPFSPTSPVPSSSPETPHNSTFLPNFPSPFKSTSASKSPSKSKTKRRPTFSRRRVRKPSSIHGSPPRRSGSGGRRRSTASSGSASSAKLRYRSASVPDLRADSTPLDEYGRRPSVPIPFDLFEPRSPYARPGRRSTEDAQDRPDRRPPAIFPSKPVRARTESAPVNTERLSGAHLRQIAAPPRTTSRGRTKESRNVVASGACEAFTFPHPRVVISGSPESGVVSAEFDHEAVDGVRRSRKEKARALPDPEEGPLNDEELEKMIDLGDRSSVRRVLRENEASRREREAWSDSATKTLGFGLGLKLADLERRKRLGTKRELGEGRRRMRKDVERRKRHAAQDDETEGEGARSTRLTVPDYSPPTPYSFEPFMNLGRKLSLSRSRDRRRPSTADGTNDGKGIIDALRRKRSASDSRRRPSTAPSADTPKVSPAHRTVGGRPIRHLRASNSVDSLYARANVTTSSPVVPPPAPRVLSFHDDSAQQYGQAVTAPVDDVSHVSVETRRPSVTTQNAFLSLPPHLHHLLRSPERITFTPSRAPPPVPTLAPTFCSPTSSRGSDRLSADSTASAARLSLALADQLQLREHDKQQPITLPVSSSSPLLWRLSRAEANETRTPSGEDEPTQTMQVVRSASTPAFLPAIARPSAFATPNRRPSRGVSASQTTHGDLAQGLLQQQQGVSPPLLHPNDSPSSMHARSLSSGSSIYNMDNDSNWKDLFFHPPRRPDGQLLERVAFETSSSPSSSASPQSKPSPTLRRRSGLVSPSGKLEDGRVSVASHRIEDDDQQEVFDAEEYKARRARTTQKSLEALFAAPASPSSDEEGALVPRFLGVRKSSVGTRPSTSQSTVYASAEEGVKSSDLDAHVSEIVVEPISSLSNPPARPLPTPVQQHWSTTSFAREYLDMSSAEDVAKHDTSSPKPYPTSSEVDSATPQVDVPSFSIDNPPASTEFISQQLPPTRTVPSLVLKRSVSGGSVGSQSFLEVSEDEPARPAVTSPASFMDDFSPPSSAPNSPTISVFPSGLVHPASPSLPTSPRSFATFEDASRGCHVSHLSVDSRHFRLSTTAAVAGSHSPYSNSNSNSSAQSHFSRLDETLGDFPAPPSLAEVAGEDAGSEGDDELDAEDEERMRKSSEGSDATPRLRSSSSKSLRLRPSQSSTLSTSTSQYTVESTSSDDDDDDDQGMRRRIAGIPFPALSPPQPTDRTPSTQSFLDIAGSPDRDSKRWSGTLSFRPSRAQLSSF